MTDIVERLRELQRYCEEMEAPNPAETARDGADEIERLRRRLRAACSSNVPSEVIDRTDFDWHWPVYGKAEK